MQINLRPLPSCPSVGSRHRSFAENKARLRLASARARARARARACARADRQTDRRTDGRTDRQTDRQTDGERETDRDRDRDRDRGRQRDRDRETERQRDRQTQTDTDRQTQTQTHKHINKHKHTQPNTTKHNQTQSNTTKHKQTQTNTNKHKQTQTHTQIKTRGRLARKHFATGAHPSAETPFYIAAASVSARGDAQCVWSHESSISSSYFPLELRRAISHESGLRKLHCSRLLRASYSLQAAARCCTQVLCASCSAQVL